MEPLFDHEKLTVYQRSISFVAWAATISEKIPKSSSLHDQLDRASTSIPLNIAEGNGKWSKKDRCRYFDIARGSSLECAAALDVGIAKKFFTEQEMEPGKTDLANIVRMLIGLIKANDPQREFGDINRVKESASFYGANVETEEQEQDC
tara:strand:- start:2268 stop:2714 length:447 start_codon:yes stop_codon:yes gene_type:complete